MVVLLYSNMIILTKNKINAIWVLHKKNLWINLIRVVVQNLLNKNTDVLDGAIGHIIGKI
jgi:hypothetical protein